MKNIVNFSPSEDHGIELLTSDDLKVYSVGISTAGIAEIRMVDGFPDRHIIATTIDQKGIESTKELIAGSGYSRQIETKLEDVTRPLPYSDNFFDFIYARLVLHSLSKQDLINSLAELYRVLKPDRKLYVVVRSTKCPDASRKGVTYDDVTCLTRGRIVNEDGSIYNYARFFHTPETISNFLTKAGFKVNHVKEYAEKLFKDYTRKEMASAKDWVIEVVANKII